MTYIFCSSCGEKNNIEKAYCEVCGELLHNFNKYEINNEINTIDELFTNTRYTQLKNKILTLEAYETIIENIINIGENRIVYKKNMTPLERVEAIANAFSLVIYKDKGNNYGEYAYNVICIDKQFDSAIQIATLLHELTHHLFNEIIKEIFMYIWNVKKTALLDSLIETIMTIQSVLIISEYCASSTEKAYLQEEFVSYSSFNSICAVLNYDKSILSRAFIIGKSMSESILKILESFIDKELKEDIKQEFIKNNTKAISNPICITDNAINNPILRNTYLMDTLIFSYELINDEEIYPRLNKNTKYFEKSYYKGAYN